MSDPFLPTHPLGESAQSTKTPQSAHSVVTTYDGQVHINWDSEGHLTPMGQLPFFIEFLKTGGLFDKFVEDCPLSFSSNNAHGKRDILGTLVLSILSGHTRYAHITALRFERVNSKLLGMNKVVSEDSARLAFKHADESLALNWLSDSLHYSYDTLLDIPWVLDIDATVKTLYGHQECAEVGYNPHKPGRPSHVYHSYFMSNIRMALDVDLHSGKEVAGCYSMSALFDFLAKLPRERWPAFLRGDISYGTEPFMAAAEAVGIDYLFKLKCTKKIKALIAKRMVDDDWVDAGQGFEGVSSQVRLSGWTKTRRVVLLRRRINDKQMGIVHPGKQSKQLSFDFANIDNETVAYEYAVLVTSLNAEVLTIAQHYRDRADGENNFDELKNQWGWCGFVTQDAKRCKIMAKMIALVYNWWTIYSRLIDPNAHREAITTRPLLLQAVGRLTQHSRKKNLTVMSTHAKAAATAKKLCDISAFFNILRESAEQLTPKQCLARILRMAFRKFIIMLSVPPPEGNLLPA